ncbi:methyltransferase tdiE [Apiospora kogelbergensis]|uniref:methyltransferase tdiE n=1 Tax=Apiospora kogelbergensis TaxID=1337665 RepID=UPI00312F7E15
MMEVDHDTEAEETFYSTDNDSAIEMGSSRTSTYSMTSSVAERLEENGRTYHSYKDGKYLLPNDEAELNRLDIQHKMWEITLDGNLHLAPIGPSPHYLNSGGISNRCSDRYRPVAYTARIVSQPQTGAKPAEEEKNKREKTLTDPRTSVPQNCEFQIDDAEDEWLFSRPFDYIHGRACATCFKRPEEIFRKAFDALRPGGWFEMQDLNLQTSEDGSIEGTTLKVIQNEIHGALASVGMRWDNVPRYAAWMRAVGFEEVTEVVLRWPSNPWWPADPKEKTLGTWFLGQIQTGVLESVTTRIFMTKLGWSKDRLDEFLVRAKRDLNDPKIKAYSPV